MQLMQFLQDVQNMHWMKISKICIKAHVQMIQKKNMHSMQNMQNQTYLNEQNNIDFTSTNVWYLWPLDVVVVKAVMMLLAIFHLYSL